MSENWVALKPKEYLMVANVTPRYQLGNTSGRYFTQWRIDLLEELLRYVANGFHAENGVPVDNVKIWYDKPNDFHCLSFTSNGHDILVKFYIVFSSEVDGKRVWQGCPRRQIIEFATSLRKAVSGNMSKELVCVEDFQEVCNSQMSYNGSVTETLKALADAICELQNRVKELEEAKNGNSQRGQKARR